ncbi:MAG: mannose-6-phosphate isomerase [Dysgonamonadaceae bacterium]|jgi:mannose-6-phosphate isomerase|nr:mannose-6-phosphate isomerase [Dysgonamonadaceae bacterium]
MLYPFTFKPVFKSVLWGGDAISKYKHIHPRLDGIGESWEISALPGNVSIVADGKLKGLSLTDLIASYGEKLLGKKAITQFGYTFPLLIKLIDAKQDLSVQVHPNDRLARERHHASGKTEMWYVIKASEDSYLYSGFSKEITPERYLQSLNVGTFLSYLAKHKVKPGDVFFIPAGRVHAIGAGCLIAEIQQTSDITYRIYDYDRKDKDGKKRELHTELAKEAIDYRLYPEYKLTYQQGNEVRNLVDSDYFITNLIEGKKGNNIHLTHNNTFVIYICIEGNIRLTDNKGNTLFMKQGETCLIPAENAHLVIIHPEKDSKLLETFI